MWRPFPALGLALGCALALAVTGCESDPLFPDLTDVRWIDVTAGGFHSCGVSSDGMGFCWGSNSSGQLGTAASVDEAASPVDVSGGATLLQIDAGAAHTCAVSSQGGVLCWGDNQFGQVGDGTVLDQFVPIEVLPSGTFVSVSAGGGHTCALDAQGRASCWGRNDRGQLGRPDGEANLVPRSVETDRRFLTISAGMTHTCAVSTEAMALCWGDNTAGQLGIASASDSFVPVVIEPAYFSVHRIAAGFDHSCAVTLAGECACWGSNSGGQLGVDGPSSARTPLRLPGEFGAVDISVAGDGWSCGLVGRSSLGDAWCWGSNSALELDSTEPVRIAVDLSSITQLSLGDAHLCVLVESGEAFCWGRGTGGQLGSGSFADSAVPLRLEN